MSIRERDTQLDAYRALTMIYILCVIHIAYWFGAIGEPTKSWILVEMPVIFFISGAALQVSDKKRSLGQTIVNRAKRVLLPYYAYAFVCCIIGVCVMCISGELTLLKCVKIFVKILIPKDGVLPVPYVYHLWFIIPYLFLSCIFGIQIKYVNKIPPLIFIILLLLLCIGAQIVTGILIIREIVFYNVFFVAGYLYYRKLSIKQISICLVVSSIVFACLYFTQWKGSMQTHKFPPDMLFLSFGVMSLCIFGIIFTYVKVPKLRILDRWNKHGYTIYLWQNITFLILLYGSELVFGRLIIDSKLAVVLNMVAIFCIATMLSYIAVPIEKAFVMGVSKLWSILKGYTFRAKLLKS